MGLKSNPVSTLLIVSHQGAYSYVFFNPPVSVFLKLKYVLGKLARSVIAMLLIDQNDIFWPMHEILVLIKHTSKSNEGQTR